MTHHLTPMSPEEAAAIKEKIAKYNDSVAPPEPGRRAEKLVFRISGGEDGKRDIIGGLIASIDAHGTLELENLWIDGRYRGRKLASALICEAERYARERGCVLSIVATWSYQARPLYEKHGYTLCSTVTDWPEGYDSYYLSKRFDRPSRGYVPSDPIPPTEFEIARGDDADGEFIHLKLHEYNCATVPRLHPHVWSARKLVNDGATVAACAADLDSLDVGVLEAVWVAEDSRGEGLGSYLLGEVEREMKAGGGHFVVAYVFDWQLGFFEKNGYAICGKIDDHPRGHAFYVLKKVL